MAVVLGGGTSPAVADDGQWWYSAYNVDQAHSEGWTGKGVKIAVIGTQINPNYAALRGTHLTVDPKPICTNGTVISQDLGGSSSHDTGVTAFLVGNGQGPAEIRGIAPDSDVTFIGYGGDACSPPYDPANPTISSFGLALQRAMNDGVQIVTTSTGAENATDDDGKMLAEAIARGIIVVSATPNSVSEVTNGSAPNSLRGVVSVSATDADGNLQQDDATGAPVVVPNVTVAAAGVKIMAPSKTNWDSAALSTGSSISAPIVAGMLALAAQKYPDATGNQLIQSLIHNTGRDDHPLAYNPTDGLGYGAASLTRLLSVDPSQYPDENPLLNKDPRLSGSLYLPTDAQLAAAQSALGTASNSPAASAPVSAPATAPAETGAVDAILTGVIIAAIIILVLIIAAAIITIVLVTRRAKNSPRKDTP
ncbi:S8/S53 family peptidase [Microbacterium sp. SORGH_AS_0888]|uniref:S8 family peptidase n=1 Tax=Microbacterium sp. SORGH_AS_0888 TaxID=3041791 RepID=UPI002787A2FE|nr:S8/S53 family peptidase [Microbacterium sp. SORGH_AS_0888]MDQ1129582.1 hypothetical protein [Microbacterium sp. SORGH_AS_0888]